MKKNNKPYTIFQKAFIMSTQENFAKQQKTLMAELPVGDDDGSDNASNNIEEKVPNISNSLSEEFLHDHHAEDYSDTKIPQNHIVENSGTYIAFHGELHAPPPNLA
jgi:hypothetical protein